MKINKLIVSAIALFTFYSCDFLDVPPMNIIQEDAVFQSESGIKAYLATLYADLPIEDFRYTERGFDRGDKGGMRLPNACGEAMCHIADDINSIGTGGSWMLWDYGKVRRVNEFIQKFPSYKSYFKDDFYKGRLGEAYFIRAYYYFAMVKRHGGVPILKLPQEYDGDNTEALKVGRNTEKECYDFIAEDLDLAVDLLSQDKSKFDQGRADKYAAYALKSRAMLYAASIARYGKVELNGLVGIEASLADHYYELSYQAANEIIKTNVYSLYRKNQDKEKNFAELFLATDSPENIFVKYFKRKVNAHGWDVYFVPYQYRGDGYSSNMNPTLEFAEMFERKDGTPADLARKAEGARFDDPADLFKGLDARFWGSIIYPNAIFRGEPCSIQKGLIIEDGSKRENAENYENALYKAKDGTTYHIVGKSGCGRFSGNMTGLFMRKYLNESVPVTDYKENYSEQHWIDFRYAEILLNASEAAVEMNKYLDKALVWMNDLRDRADLKPFTSSDLIVEKIRRERRIELAFENQTYWDLRRWRISDKEMETKKFTGLWPYLDIRDGKYVFATGEANKYYYTFKVQMYYEPIPYGEVNINSKLIQNPYYN